MLFMVGLGSLIFAQNPILESYKLGEGLRFSGKSGYELKLTGYAQPYVDFKSYTDDNYEEGYTRFRLRRARFRISGKSANSKIDYRFQADLSGISEVGDNNAGAPLLDAWIRYSITKRIKIIFGQKATPTDNRELPMGSQTLQLVERSRLTSAFSSIREFGLFAQGNFRTGGGTYLRPQIAVTNGDGLNAFGADHGGLKFGGRIDFLPFGLFNNFGQFRQADVMRENTPKFVIGAHFSNNYGMSSRRGRAGGAIVYLNDSLRESLPNYMKFGIDFLFKYKGFSALGEFISSRAVVPSDITTRVRNDGSTSTTFLVDGVQDVENYVKGRMMLGSAYNIQMGYYFKSRISIDARYTHLKADEHSFLNNGTFYNRPNYYTLGVSKYFGRGYGFKIQGDVTYNEALDGSNDLYGTPMNGNEWVFRIITTISF